MRKFIATLTMAGLLGLSSLTAVQAAPVPGFEELYAAAFAACTPSGGAGASPAACQAAILALSQAMIAAGIPADVALLSFTQLRAEVAAAGGGAAIEALFEELLPESGAVTTASPTA